MAIRRAERIKQKNFSRDRVELRGDRLTIITPVAVNDMPGWEVRRYRAAVIRFDGRTWRIIARSTAPDRTTRYDLVAWQPGTGEVTGPEIEYDADVVALRDHSLHIGRRRSRVTGLLRLIAPLTGFLPARAKDRLETVYGIDPVFSTFASLWIELLVAFGGLTLASIAVMVKAFGRDSELPIAASLAAAAVALLDAAVRWSSEERPAPGFYEWLFRRRRPGGH